MNKKRSCHDLHKKVSSILSPAAIEATGIERVNMLFVYGLLKELRISPPLDKTQMYSFSFNLCDSTVSSRMDGMSRVRQIHPDQERLFDIFEKHGWEYRAN